jgi:bifunctional DNA-binding transcriptional regulator/antitoxin component of YhaV-PrlF toxin-antitoxin module
MSETTTIQLRPRGALTLPPAVRAKYGLADGDAVDVVDLDGVLLLVPRELAVPRLAAEMEKLRRKARVSLKALGGPARED